MPNTITHLIFADEILRRLPREKRETILKNPEAYKTGALGFDFFFVLRQLGLEGGRLSNRFHREKTREVFEAIALNGNENGEIFSYGAGLATHYALDRTLHPAVAYLHETALSKYYPAEYQNNLHNLVETALDEYAIARAGLDPDRFDASKGAISKKAKRAVSRFYADTLIPMLGETLNADKVAFSLTLWIFMGKISNDPKGRKRRFIRFLERNKEKRPLTALTLPAVNPNGADLLNRNKIAYPEPRDGEKRSDLSLPERYDAAILFSEKLLSAYFDYGNDPNALANFDFSVDYEGILNR